MSDELSRRRSLDSLRKEAKRWLAALRAHHEGARARLERAHPDAPADPTLRDVQLAIARELGFDGWAALRNALEASARVRTHTLEQYETMAEALLEAYRSGTPTAMERHWRLTWHRRPWQGMRTYVQLDLGRNPMSVEADAEISIDDARFLVAREHGFENWAALASYVARTSVKTPIAAKPATVSSIDARAGTRTVLGSRDWSAILEVLAQQASSELRAEGQMTDALMDELSRCDNITSLRLGGSKALTDDGVRHLARLPRLRHVDLSGTAITDRGLAALRELRELESVSLAWTRVTDAGVAHLSGAASLERVDLSGTRAGDGAIGTLAGLPRLRDFRSGGAVTDAGLSRLQEFPVFRRWHGGEVSMALTSYDAEPNYLLLRGTFTDRGVASLKGLDGLFALNIDDRTLPVTAAGLAPLAELPNLGWLAVDADDAAMAQIARIPRLRFLGCQDTVAGDDGFTSLSGSRSIEYIWGRRCHNLQRRGFVALSTMPSLRALSVSCKNVDDAGVAALPHFPALEELMPMDVPDTGYRHVGRCERLVSLVLMYCRDTTDAATEQIVRLLTLAHYFASYTAITDRTPELLSGMPSLERVTLAGCAGVTNRGIAALARLPKLRELHLSGKGITAEVADAFPASVRVEYSL